MILGATIHIVNAGYSAKLKHRNRTHTHKLSVASLSETISSLGFFLKYTDSGDQLADMFIKTLMKLKFTEALGGNSGFQVRLTQQLGRVTCAVRGPWLRNALVIFSYPAWPCKPCCLALWLPRRFLRWCCAARLVLQCLWLLSSVWVASRHLKLVSCNWRIRPAWH